MANTFYSPKKRGNGKIGPLRYLRVKQTLQTKHIQMNYIFGVGYVARKKNGEVVLLVIMRNWCSL